MEHLSYADSTAKVQLVRVRERARDLLLRGVAVQCSALLTVVEMSATAWLLASAVQCDAVQHSAVQLIRHYLKIQNGCMMNYIENGILHKVQSASCLPAYSLPM